MADEITSIEPSDDFSEEWIRETSEPDIRDLGVAQLRDGGTWEVSIALAEFVRDDPLEADMRRHMQEALAGVLGVTTVTEHDRETWDVAGNPSGQDLIRAAAGVLDGLAGRSREYMRRLWE